TRSTCSRWRRLKISSQSRHSERIVRTNRSAIAFAFGARTGVFTIRMPSLRKTSSKGSLYLLSRSRIRKRTPLSLKSLRACWVTHAPVGTREQPNARRGDDEAQLAELAADLAVAPARVLTR